MRADRNNALDLLTLSVAGMRDGVGPLLTVFLIQKTHWSPLYLSWVLASQSFANLTCQIPVGFCFDRIRDQRILVALGGLLMGASAFCISLVPTFPLMILIQCLSGLGSCFLSVGIPAVSLSAVSATGFGTRLARNEIFSKLGNFGVIALTGYVAQKFSLYWMFYVVYGLAAMVVVSCACLRVKSAANSSVTALPGIVDSTPSSQEPSTEEVPVTQSTPSTPSTQSVATTKTTKPANLAEIIRVALQKPEFVRIVLLSFLFQFGNASMFYIFEQSFVRQQRNGGAGAIASALFATQMVIVLGSLAIARWKRSNSPFKLMGIGFGLIFSRAVIFSFQLGIVSLALGQVLDGCIAAILIIVPLRSIASFSDESFNVMSGVLGMSIGLGSVLSMLLAGYLITAFSFVPAFMTYGALGLLGVGLTRMVQQANRVKEPMLRQ